MLRSESIEWNKYGTQKKQLKVSENNMLFIKVKYQLKMQHCKICSTFCNVCWGWNKNNK